MDVLKQISEVRHLFLDSGCVVVCVLRSLVAGCLLPVLHCSMLCDLAAPHNPLCARQGGDVAPVSLAQYIQRCSDVVVGDVKSVLCIHAGEYCKQQ